MHIIVSNSKVKLVKTLKRPAQTAEYALSQQGALAAECSVNSWKPYVFQEFKASEMFGSVGCSNSKCWQPSRLRQQPAGDFVVWYSTGLGRLDAEQGLQLSSAKNSALPTGQAGCFQGLHPVNWPQACRQEGCSCLHGSHREYHTPTDCALGAADAHEAAQAPADQQMGEGRGFRAYGP